MILATKKRQLVELQLNAIHNLTLVQAWKKAAHRQTRAHPELLLQLPAQQWLQYQNLSPLLGGLSPMSLTEIMSFNLLLISALCSLRSAEQRDKARLHPSCWLNVRARCEFLAHSPRVLLMLRSIPFQRSYEVSASNFPCRCHHLIAWLSKVI